MPKKRAVIIGKDVSKGLQDPQYYGMQPIKH